MRGGLQPDLLNDAGWWHIPLWRYAVLALVIYTRAAAERLDITPAQIAQRVATQHDFALDSSEDESAAAQK
jgi:hypothetical protein